MKGAVLLLEDGEGGGLNLETDPAPTSSIKGGRSSDRRHRQLHAMVELLRPEDTIKLVRNQISRTLKMSRRKNFVCDLVI